MPASSDSVEIDDPLDGEMQSSPCLQGERVSFTGTLASMTHRQAHDFVRQHGGSPASHVSRQLSMLVVGEEGWPLDPDGQPSQKLIQVQQLQQDGQQIQIVNESDWLQLLGLDEQMQEVHRNYTPAMLSKLLDVPVSRIRAWERAGLIRPVRRVHRLPYFDFQEVTSARRLSELLAAGVARSEIEDSLRKLEAILGDVERPLAQLSLLERDSRVIFRDDRGLLHAATGQRMFEFDPDAATDSDAIDFGEDDTDIADGDTVAIVPFPSLIAFPDSDVFDDDLDTNFAKSNATVGGAEWFDRGCQLMAEGRAEGAVHAFRMSLMDFPGDPEASFHLAEALYLQGNVTGALERYYTAVEQERYYVEAWTQIACLHAELGEFETALSTFDVALDLHADFPDAHWHKANVLHQLDRLDEAVEHWDAYLRFDSRGPWAENARQRSDEVKHDVLFFDDADSNKST